MSINVRCVAVLEEKEDAETSGRYDPKQDKLINSYAELDRGEHTRCGHIGHAGCKKKGEQILANPPVCP